jgi:hypothetical protein
MSRAYRLAFLLLSLALLVICGFVATGSLRFLMADFWFTAGLLMLILLSIIDQPHFSRDANIFVNGVTGLASLGTVNPGNRTNLWYTFFIWSLYLVIASFVLMAIRSRELPAEGLGTRLVSRIDRVIGRPEALFSAFFLWGVFTQFGEDSAAFQLLLLYWAVFMILSIPSVAQAIATAFVEKATANDSADGFITRFVSPRVFECQLRPDTPQLPPGSAVTLHSGNGGIAGTAVVLDDRVLLNGRQARVAVVETRADWGSLANSSPSVRPHITLRRGAEVPPDRRPCGAVSEGTDIGTLRLSVDPDADLEKGEVVRVTLQDGRPGYFQVVSARVAQEIVEPQVSAIQTVQVAAGQLGVWQPQDSRFDPVTWVAPAGSLVFRVPPTTAIESILPDGHVVLGYIPKSPFPVHLDIDSAVTHNTAAIGVTGSGKTYLALHLIEAMLDRGIRVLVLDLSRQHWTFLTGRNPTAVRTAGDVRTWLAGAASLAVHQYAVADNYPRQTADLVEEVFRHLSTTVTLRPGLNEPARVCVVFEEAHSLIPELNQVADRNDTNQVNRTARVLLQGRKYGMGCLVITQRTANVTKTVLNQCNTILALQCFDETGLNFLKNYMGEDQASEISNLRPRQAVAVGRASSSARPVMFEIRDLGQRWAHPVAHPAPAL